MLIFVLLLPFLAIAQQQTQIKVGQTLQRFQGKWMAQKGDYFVFQLDEIKKDSDIVVMVRAINPGGDPNIYISQVHQNPSEKSEGEIASCESKGNDLCVIDKSQLTVGNLYFIGVICNGNCRYTIRVDYDQEYVLSQNDFVQFKINSEQSSELIKINIGQANKTDVDLEIEVKVINYYELENEFNVYLKKGDIIPSSESYDHIGIDSWSGAKIIVIPLKELQMGTKLSMSIVAQMGALIQVKTSTYGEQRELGFYEKVNGVVQKSQYNLYRLKLDHFNYVQENEKIKFFIKLVPFSGHATLYAHPTIRPALLNQYKYHYEEQSTQILMISSKEFEAYNSESQKTFYIAIYGDEQCSYELSSGFQDFEYQFIELNVPYEGRLYNDELINYWFVVTGTKPKNVTVSLTKYEGDTNMIVKRCTDFECRIIQDDIKDLSSQYSQNPDNLFIYSQEKGNQILIFTYDPQVCNQFGDFYSCTYVAAIYPIATSTSMNDEYSYQILVSKSTSHVQLRENTPHKSVVDRNQFNYYKFNIEDTNIQRLTIILTPIQGRFQFYTSYKQKRPDQEGYDKKSLNNVIRYGTESNESIQQGPLYISVYGETAGFYTITIVALRDMAELREIGRFAWQYTQLYEGNPQDYVLDQGDVGLYKIDLTSYINREQQSIKYKEPLLVELQKVSGEVSMLGFDHPTTDDNEALWYGTSEIHINQQDENYPEVLYLRVFPDDQFAQTQFRIVYRLGWKTTQLVLGENYYGYIEKGTYQYFSFTFYKKEDVILTKHSQSYNDSELIVNVMAGNSQLQLQSSTSMVISAQDIPIEKCRVSSSDLYYCQISIEVKSDIATFYSLLISKDDTQIELTVDEPVYKNLPENVHHYYLKFYGNDVVINVVNLQQPQQLQILVGLVSSNDYSDKTTYPYPTNNASNHTISVSKSHANIAHSQVSIFREEILEKDECKNMCILIITVKKIEGIQYMQNSNSLYSILYSSASTQLQEFITLFESVKKDYIKYFRVHVYLNDTNLRILVNPLSVCEVDIVVSKYYYPDQDEYDWTSRDYLGDQLVIESGNELYPDMEGTYYIGVYGFNNCSFSIVYQTGHVHYYPIQTGIPINLFLKIYEIAYFKYYHYSDKDFTVLLNSANQQARFYIQQTSETATESNDFYQTPDTYTYNNDGKGYNNHFKVTQTRAGIYMIAVYAFDDSDFVIAVQEYGTNFYIGKDVLMMNQINKNEVFEYLFYSRNDTVLKVEMLSGFIEVSYGSQLDSNLQTKSLFKTISTVNQVLQPPANHSGFFKIVIKGVEESMYKIKCSDYELPMSITIGEMYDFVLNKMQSKQFIYNSFNKREGQTFSVTASVMFNTVGKTTNLKQQMPTIIVKYPNTSPDSIHQIIPIQEVYADNSYYAEYPDEAGEYLIEIKNFYSIDKQISYGVIFGNSLISNLVSNFKMVGSLSKDNTKFWEYYCPNEGQLFLQIEQCGALLQFYGSDKLDSLKTGQYHEQFKSDLTLYEKTINISHTGQYYLATKVLSPQNTSSQAPYTIRAQFVNSDSNIPITDLQPGNKGQLSWELYEKDDKYFIKVTGQPLYIDKLNPEFTLASVYYYLIYDYLYSNDDTPFDYCLEIHNYQKYVQLKVEQKDQPFTLIQELNEGELEKAQQIHFNVYSDAIVKLKHEEPIHLNRYYNSINIRNDYLETFRWKKYIRYTFAIILIIAFIIALYQYYKRRKFNESMRFEASDQPNIEMYYRGLND